MKRGWFISFEGTEASGKSTQIKLLIDRLRGSHGTIRMVREPGGTAIGEEIRHILQHSANNASMTAEAELLLLNASRAQLVREIIRPALAAGEIVICDRFYHSTIAYQGYGRQLDLALVNGVIDFAIGNTRPDATILLSVPIETSESRRYSRKTASATPRDRMEQLDREFFLRVEEGYKAVAAAEPERVHVIDATPTIERVSELVWERIDPLLRHWNKTGGGAG